MGTKTWTANIDGNEILVTNHFSLFKWESWESLELNGELIQRNDRTLLRQSSYLTTTIRTRSGDRTLEILIGQLGFSSGCHILVDDDLVAGDVDVKLNVPNRTEWLELQSAGVFPFILERGIVMMGLPYAIMMTLMTALDSDLTAQVGFFFFYLLSFGGSMGYLLWWSFKKQFEEHG